MILWIFLIALTLLALALLLAPLLRRRTSATTRADFDIEVYLDQLRELERDETRGVIAAGDVAAARTEIERRLLAAERARGAAIPPGRQRPLLAAFLVVAVSAAALALYLQIGSPRLPDQPFAERPTAPDNDLVARANARIAEAEASVRSRPEEPRAWFDLGRLRFFAKKWPQAAEAFAEAARLAPDRADYAAAWGEALIFGADGMVSPQARSALELALVRDPGDPRARYYIALAEQQAGRPAEALDRLAALLRDSPADAPWRERVETRIRELAAETGTDAEAVLGAAAPRGPGAADIAAAQQMAPEDRNAMIRTMVEGLAARLADAPDDVAGWRRLAQSWSVLGEPAKSSAAYGRALTLEPDDPQTLFNGADAALDAGDRDTARQRFTRLRGMIPPENEAFGAVERAIRELDERQPGTDPK